MNAVVRRIAPLIDRWLLRLRPAEPLPLRLVQRRIFVLPTRFGLVFAVTLLVMLLTSINYNLGLGYVLTFTLGGIGVASILHAFRNLLHLQIHAAPCPSVHAGDVAGFSLRISNDASRPRTALVVTAADSGSSQRIDIRARDDRVVTLPVPARDRGWMLPGRISIATTYPLGMIRAWSVLTPALRCLVYPRPETPPQPLPLPAARSAGVASGDAGEDDFAGLREHQPADQPGHVAWRLAARSEQLFTKQFTGGGCAELELRWSDLPDSLDTEARIARLTRWTLLAEAAGVRFGLVLPGQHIGTDSGATHRDRCLRALALFGRNDA